MSKAVGLLRRRPVHGRFTAVRDVIFGGSSSGVQYVLITAAREPQQHPRLLCRRNYLLSKQFGKFN